MNVEVNANLVPTFTQLGPYCQGAVPVALPTVSTNGITGTWNAAISTLNAGTTTYTFTPATKQCAVGTTMVVQINARPTATISGGATVCQNAPAPEVRILGANGSPAYSFVYTLNAGSEQTLISNGNAGVLAPSTAVAGSFVYTLVSVTDANGCGQNQSGSVMVNVQGKPTINLNVNGSTVKEGQKQELCDIDANPVNSLQFTVSGLCVCV